MSTEPQNAPVTEAHRKIVSKILFTITEESGAQLIANFVAFETAALRERVSELTAQFTPNGSIARENEQLRASCLAVGQLCGEHEKVVRERDALRMAFENEKARAETLSIVLVLPTGADPFARAECHRLDYGHADNILTVACPEATQAVNRNDAIAAQCALLREALNRIVTGIPAVDQGGQLFIVHQSENGEEIGCEHVDPLAVIQSIQGVANSALAASPETASAELGSADKWLVWSNEHGAWWGPNQSGYFTDIRSAGRYSSKEAKECCGSRSASGKLPPEVMISERDAFSGKNPNAK